jgi:5'-deoxynucleotidase YfbR-like HD superfamily hydrolase
MSARFDNHDLSRMTTMDLSEYLKQLEKIIESEDNEFIERAIQLRIYEVMVIISEIEREIAIRNVAETNRQGL